MFLKKPHYTDDDNVDDGDNDSKKTTNTTTITSTLIVIQVSAGKMNCLPQLTWLVAKSYTEWW